MGDFQYGTLKFKQNDNIQQKTKSVVVNAFKKTCLTEQYYRHCSSTAIFSEKVNLILSVGCNNQNKLKVTLQFPLAKVTFN